jgi:hypothetical protein
MVEAPLLKAGGRSTGKRAWHQERSQGHSEFVIYLRGGISFIYLGSSFETRRDPFWF